MLRSGRLRVGAFTLSRSRRRGTEGDRVEQRARRESWRARGRRSRRRCLTRSWRPPGPWLESSSETWRTYGATGRENVRGPSQQSAMLMIELSPSTPHPCDQTGSTRPQNSGDGGTFGDGFSRSHEECAGRGASHARATGSRDTQISRAARAQERHPVERELHRRFIADAF
jgi:hypothetical protein